MTNHVSKCLCHQIVENTQDGIIFADSSGVIKVWNSGAQSIFGYSSEEALGETLDLIIPDKHRKQHWEGYRKVMKTGISSYNERLLAVPSFRKDGERISVEFSIVILRDPESQQLGAAAIIRDVTLRWQEQRALKKQIIRVKAKIEEFVKSINETFRCLWTKVSELTNWTNEQC